MVNLLLNSSKLSDKSCAMRMYVYLETLGSFQGISANDSLHLLFVALFSVRRQNLCVI